MTVVWDEAHKSFTGKERRFLNTGADNERLRVSLHYKDGVPVQADVSDSARGKFATIKYRYSPAFYDGRLPVEFTRYSGGENIFTVRIQDLQSSREPLPPDTLDPRRAVPLVGKSARQNTIIISNNLSYGLGPGGELVPSSPYESTDVGAAQSHIGSRREFAIAATRTANWWGGKIAVVGLALVLGAICLRVVHLRRRPTQVAQNKRGA